MTRQRVGVALALAALTLAPATAARAAGRTTVLGVERYQPVVLRDRSLTLGSPRVRGQRGAVVIVVFEIRNESHVARRFGAGRYRSRVIAPGQTLNASVAFRTAGTVRCRATAAAHRPLQGVFRIVA